MSRIEFPNEPIRVDAGEYVTPRELTPEEREEERIWDEEYDEYEDSCMTCRGDGFSECDDDDHYCRPHLVTCPNCRGSGAAKDQWYW